MAVTRSNQNSTQAKAALDFFVNPNREFIGQNLLLYREQNPVSMLQTLQELASLPDSVLLHLMVDMNEENWLVCEKKGSTLAKHCAKLVSTIEEGFRNLTDQENLLKGSKNTIDSRCVRLNSTNTNTPIVDAYCLVSPENITVEELKSLIKAKGSVLVAKKSDVDKLKNNKNRNTNKKIEASSRKVDVASAANFLAELKANGELILITDSEEKKLNSSLEKSMARIHTHLKFEKSDKKIETIFKLIQEAIKKGNFALENSNEYINIKLLQSLGIYAGYVSTTMLASYGADQLVYIARNSCANYLMLVSYFAYGNPYQLQLSTDLSIQLPPNMQDAIKPLRTCLIKLIAIEMLKMDFENYLQKKPKITSNQTFSADPDKDLYEDDLIALQDTCPSIETMIAYLQKQSSQFSTSHRIPLYELYQNSLNWLQSFIPARPAPAPAPRYHHSG